MLTGRSDNAWQFVPGESLATQALFILVLPRGIRKKRNGSFHCKKHINCMFLPSTSSGHIH